MPDEPTAELGGLETPEPITDVQIDEKSLDESPPARYGTAR